MIIGHGIDMVDIARIARSIATYEDRFIKRLFTPWEQSSAPKQKIAAYYAKRFAAKEAFVKAIGTGFAEQITWQDIEILNFPSGQPYIKVYHQAKTALEKLLPALAQPVLHVSLGDTDHLGYASVIIEARIINAY